MQKNRRDLSRRFSQFYLPFIWSLLPVKTRCQLMSICQQCFQLLYIVYFSIYNHNILMSNCFVNSCSYILSVRQLSECWLPYAFSPYLKESLDGFGKHWKRKKRRVFSIPNFMRIFGNTCSFGRKARIYVGKSILYNLSKWKCRSF